MNKFQARQHSHLPDPQGDLGRRRAGALVNLPGQLWDKAAERNFQQGVITDAQRIPGEVQTLNRYPPALLQGLSDFTGVTDLHEGNPLGVALGLMAAPSLVGTRIAKGALKAYPTLFDTSLFDEGLRYGWGKFKKALPTASAATALSLAAPEEAQAGGIKQVIQDVSDELLGYLQKLPDVDITKSTKPYAPRAEKFQRLLKRDPDLPDELPPDIEMASARMLSNTDVEPGYLLRAIKDFLNGRAE